jgi:hypothetical protein
MVWNPFSGISGLLSGANADEETPFGVPAGDVRMAQAGLLGNIGATLLAAGQRISPADRARLLSQIGPQTAQFSTDIYNAAQRRYQQGMLEEAQRKQTLAEELALTEEERKAAEARWKAGEPARMAEGATVATAMGQPTYRATKYENGVPTGWEREGSAYSPQDQYLTLIRAGFPSAVAEGFLKAGAPAEKKLPAISESEARSILAQVEDDPPIVSTPRYAQAFDAVYGAKMQTRRDEFGNVETWWENPPIPPGVPRPTYGLTATQAQAQATQAPAPQPQATTAQAQPTQAPAPQPQATQPTQGRRIVEAPITQEQKTRADTISEIGTLTASLRSELNSLYGAQGVLPGEKKTKIQSAVSTIRLKLKEANKLGALSGSDYEALDAILRDPTAFGSAVIGGPAAARARTLTQLEEILNQLYASSARLPESIRPDLPPRLSPEQSRVLNNYLSVIGQKG